MTVARPTPTTPMPSGTTKMRLRMTFTTPLKARQASGRRVSPWLRSMAAPKLYTMLTGIPAKEIRR